MKKTLLFICISLLFACEKDDDAISNKIDVDFKEFQKFEENELNYYSNLELPQNISFFGEAIKTGSGDLLISKVSGDCGLEEVEDCFDLEALDPQTGFKQCDGLYGLDCYNFLIAIRDGETIVINKLSEFRHLVGDIDSLPELVFVIRSESYWVGLNNIERGAYKKVADGYEVIATKLVSDCAPVVTNRYHLKVSNKGSVKILAEEEISRSEGCI